MVSQRYIPDVHQQPINRVLFAPDTKVTMTSSESDRASALFTKVTLKGEVWSVEQVADESDDLSSCGHMVDAFQ